jgi:outer membrane protein assembly factor BamB
MSRTHRAAVVLLNLVFLAGLSASLQTAGAAPQAEGKKEQKAKPAAPEKKPADGPIIIGGGPPPAAKPAVRMNVMQAVQVAPAQPPAPPGATPAVSSENELTDALTLPSDRKINKMLETAEDYKKNETWDQVAKILQAVLNAKEDVFVPVKRKDAHGQDRISRVSARAEANRLLAGLDPKGLEFYELQYGAQAKALLADAKKNADYRVLGDVAQRFFHTDAGAEATDLLGTYYLDRGQARNAVACFQRLLHREGADQLSALTLSKAALAFRLVGDAANLTAAQDVEKRLAAKLGRDGLRIGEETISLADLRKELERASPVESVIPYNWQMFRGDASRSARARGSAPFLEKAWQASLVGQHLGPDARELIERTLRGRKSGHQKGQLTLPVFSPVAAADKLVYRDYSTVHAVDIKTGNLLWYTLPFRGSLDSMCNPQKSTGTDTLGRTVEEWLAYYTQAGNSNIVFENSLVSTLSTDNTYVYAVDDMAVPPHPNVLQNGQPFGMNGVAQGVPASFIEMSKRSVLIAINLESGKREWEQGPEANASLGTTEELADSYFLGAPLPLDGKLYVLNEKNAELRLVCLDPANKGKPVWTQALASVRERLQMDVSRRIQAVHLAYADGILVCPTNAGAILGVDLLTRSLLWAFPYREKSRESGSDHGQVQMMMRGRFRPVPWGGEWPGSLQKLSTDWKMTAPIIVDGKVVFTAPDGSAIHCLNLQTGDALWQAERQNDLYVAGVFPINPPSAGSSTTTQHSPLSKYAVVLVGKDTCRALNLADGRQQLWQVETGAPSGMGAAIGSYYYLPLKKGAICRIDLNKGTSSTIPAPTDEKGEAEIPGNLVFYEGRVVSQTETRLTAFEQVDAKVAQITTLLQKNPRDPAALTDRGELRLSKGDLSGAVADLRDALRYGSADRAARTRDKLYATLTELFKDDFNAAEPYLTQYRELCAVTVPPGASTDERQKAEAEQRRRQERFLSLLGRGREQQGRLVDAFRAYLEFSALAGSKELVSVVNDPTIRAQPQIWAQGRMAALAAKATPAERETLKDEIAKRWKTVEATKDLSAMRDFVDAFGSLFGVGLEARFQYQDRLVEKGAYAEAELQLNALAQQSDDRHMAARATEALARLMTRRGLLEDAAHFYRILGREYASVLIRDGKTGAEILRELATDKRFLPYLDTAVAPFLNGTVQATEIFKDTPRLQSALPCEGKGELLPSMQRFRFLVSVRQDNGMPGYQLTLVDRNTDEEYWVLPSPSARLMYNLQSSGDIRVPYYAIGHLAFVYLGSTVAALDVAEKKKLWQRPLVAADRLTGDPQGQMFMLSLDRDGGLQMANPHGGTEKLGQIGPVTSTYVCLYTPDGLVALDPVRGNVLWTKTDVTPQTRIFGDEQNVYFIEARDSNNFGVGRAIRGRDGATVPVSDFAAAFQHRLRSFGGRLLVSENAAGGGTQIRLYDIITGKDVWKKSLPASSVVLGADSGDLTGFVEPTGDLTVIDLHTLREAMHAHVDPAHLKDVNEGWLLEDGNQIYVALNRKGDDGGGLPPGYSTNFSGMRTMRVNGTVYAFHRDTGKRNWYYHAVNQRLLVEQFQELPMLVFSAHFSRPANAAGNMIRGVETLSIDKRSGKRLYSKKEEGGYSLYMAGPFHTLRVDPALGIVDLTAPKHTLRHYVGSRGASADVTTGHRSSVPERQYLTSERVRRERPPERLFDGARPAK